MAFSRRFTPLFFGFALIAFGLSGCSNLGRLNPDRLVPEAVKPSNVRDRLSRIPRPGFLRRNPEADQPAEQTANQDRIVIPVGTPEVETISVAPTVIVPNRSEVTAVPTPTFQTPTFQSPVINVPSVEVPSFSPPVVAANPTVSVNATTPVLTPVVLGQPQVPQLQPLAINEPTFVQGANPIGDTNLAFVNPAIRTGDVLPTPSRIPTPENSAVSPDTGYSYLLPATSSASSASIIPTVPGRGFAPSNGALIKANTTVTPQFNAQPIQIQPLNQTQGVQTTNTSSSGFVANPVPIQPVSSAPLVAPTNEVLQPSFSPSGALAAKAQIALLLPTGETGQVGQIATQMRNAALLARDDAGNRIDLKFYDTKGTTSAVQFAASNAASEGAELILGPLKGSNIGSVYSVSNLRGINLVSFSNDTSQARPGAFILGVGPDQSVERILTYVGKRGLRRIAILAPKSAYGRRALQAAQSTAFSNGLSIVGTFTYDAASGSEERKSAAKSVAEAQEALDAVLIADTAGSAREMGALLLFNQFDTGKKQILGTDLWLDDSVGREKGLQGALFAATDDTQWQGFRSRYQSRFGNDPQRVAGIAYDAVQMASQLASQRRFDASALTSSSYNGVFGTYRLTSAGRSARDLDIRQVVSGGSAVLLQGRLAQR